MSTVFSLGSSSEVSQGRQSKSVMWKSSVLLVVLCVAVAGAADSWRPVRYQRRVATPLRRVDTETPAAPVDDGRWWLPVSQLRGLRSLYEQCIAPETEDYGVSCLKSKALVLIGRAMTKQNVTLTEGLSLVRTDAGTEGASRNMRMLTTEKQLQEALPQDPRQKDQRLDEMLIEYITSFFQTHTLNIDFESRELKESFSEARKKSKKGLPYILFALFAMKKLALAYSLKMIALIAAKALLIAKIALVLSAVIGLKKLVSHDSDHSEVVAHTRTEPYHGGHYGRSLSHSEDEAHKLAYSNQIPRST